MSLTGTAIGALVALLPPALLKPKEEKDVKLERLERRVETLEIDCESLERELAAERRLTEHWRGEAIRIAREAREEREMRRGSQAQQQQSLQQAQALAQQFDAFCNCVPSRGQVFDAMVQQLNQFGR
jgi:hypothetical protein